MCHDCWGQFELWRYKTPRKAQARAHFENLAAVISFSAAGIVRALRKN